MNQQAIKQCKSILKKNHLHPLRKLGKGAFATQIIKRPSLNKYIKQQIQLLRNIEHDNIVKSYRTFEDQGWIFMVMEYCDKGNLNTKITETPGNVLSIEETFTIAYDIIKGLEYMHSKNIIHRDIKAENILLATRKQKKTIKSKKSITHLSSTNLSQLPLNDYLTKICDLGFAREQDESVNTFCGTTCYMAPEIFLKNNYTNKVDIWALGVLIFYMLFGDFPFKSLNVEFQIEKKCTQGFKISNIASLKPNDSISKQDYAMLDDFFRKIFVTDPEKRIALQGIKEYPWIKKLRNLNIKETSSSTKLNQKILSVPKLLQHKSSQKTTIESDTSSTGQNMLVGTQIKERNIEIEKYFFIKQIIDQVEKQKFLKTSEEVVFKYYMLKMLHSEFARILEKTGKGEYKKDLEILVLSLEKYTNLLTLNIAKISIPKFQPQMFNPKAKTFNDFKEPYRLVIGHVFAKAHKNITEDIHIRSQLKLKLFLCHVINRVFNTEHNEGIFVYFDLYCNKKPQLSKKNESLKGFSFREFREWINAEDPQKLVETVQLMNAKFYKGK